MDQRWESPRLVLITTGTSAEGGLSNVFTEHGHQLVDTVLCCASSCDNRFHGVISP